MEQERALSGGVESAVTLFLAGAECVFTCVFCDLWRHTLEGPTLSGSLPGQIERGVAELGAAAKAATAIKLYNASNFFEPRAVPDEDIAGI